MSDLRVPSKAFEKLCEDYSDKKIELIKRRTIHETKLKSLLVQGMPIHYKNHYAFNNKVSACKKLIASIGSDTEVKVRYGNFSDPYEYAFNRKTKTISFNEFISNHFIKKSGDCHYFGNYSLNENNLEILKVKKPDIHSKDDFASGQLWVGEKGCTTPLHCDGGDNFIYQVLGEKKWILFPPSEYKYLHVNLDAGYPSADFLCSSIDVSKVVEKKYPEFKRLKSIEINIKAGDSLYLPYGWFHYVETIKDSITVNFWITNKDLTPSAFK